MSDSSSIERVSADDVQRTLATEKDNDIKRDIEDNESHKSLSDAETAIEEKSIGVRKAEILAAQWSDNVYLHIILLFSAFLVGYAYGLDGSTRYIYTAYATASYAEHSLLTTVSVITSVAGAACQPVYARLSDVFGRLEIFIVSILFYVVGTIIESQATDVQKYAAGSVLYQIGYTGVILIVMCILADFSTLKWRLFYLFVPTFPYIINSWISGNVTDAVGTNWKWGVGMWAFIFPLACIPLVGCMLHMRWKAGKTEEWKVFKQRETKFQELGFFGFMKYLFWQLDIIGLLLLIVCLGCLLVPLTLAGGIKDTWEKAHIIVPIVIGGVLLPVFVLWESYGARYPVAPFHLLKDRGIWSALAISFLLNFISSIESSYLYTVLMVAINQSMKSATRISSLSSFVSVVAGVFFGLFIVKWKKLKGFIIFGCSMWMLSLGLMFHFRSGTSSYGGIIAGVCLMGFGTTFFSYPCNVSLQSCTTHEHMAVIISLGLTVYRIGSAVGASIAGAVWSQRLYSAILEKTGNSTLAQSVYTDPYTFIATYTWETVERQQVVLAYRDIQKILILVALVFCAPMIIAGLFLRDHTLGDEQSYENVEKEEKSESLGAYIKGSLGRFGKGKN
ncbi:iron-siderophore transporter [Spathaspora passalidarum NRRL Y-27907]|uniref:Iron-siderophore transporter n=1 Tax=Spathaspora passalidarum (strain NRRL Y-27907 / 11-Y1) TaxID=619300 RepID=G3AK61_SPAPN|nr:iron-siderophore transporter [Spathaspora passalidarum NRRL Y-27907]EGW32872.1 iron-siderophore transporter [Spathaspora passalidarum NRRL Y-27907]